ncbi:hypothetical protein QR680_018854 [Steinernema hermaphroditum]|uniref:Uncharacterized protein n=1 Tax=Steinernema hermaphroditum TaxID=289476 RepID=A0AA39LRG4_9BILA|nr:hypothetical protein QR680_018854 [Steinernema hermaphroditum]
MSEGSFEEPLSSFGSASSAFATMSDVFETMAPSTNTSVDFESSISEFETTSASSAELTSAVSDEVEELSMRDMEEINNYYIGAMTAAEAEQWVAKPGDFRVYFRTPTRDEVYRMTTPPLTIVYNSSENKLMHFPIVIEKSECVYGGGNTYRVDCGGREPEAMTFGSLPTLIRICRRHSYFWIDSGKLEQFPIYDFN